MATRHNFRNHNGVSTHLRVSTLPQSYRIDHRRSALWIVTFFDGPSRGLHLYSDGTVEVQIRSSTFLRQTEQFRGLSARHTLKYNSHLGRSPDPP